MLKEDFASCFLVMKMALMHLALAKSTLVMNQHQVDAENVRLHEWSTSDRHKKCSAQ